MRIEDCIISSNQRPTVCNVTSTTVINNILIAKYQNWKNNGIFLVSSPGPELQVRVFKPETKP